MIKEFTAKQMHNAPGQVFRAADKDGKAKISHDHYKDRDFYLMARDKELPCVAPMAGVNRDEFDALYPSKVSDEEFIIAQSAKNKECRDFLDSIAEAQQLMNDQPIPTDSRLTWPPLYPKQKKDESE